MAVCDVESGVVVNGVTCSSLLQSDLLTAAAALAAANGSGADASSSFQRAGDNADEKLSLCAPVYSQPDQTCNSVTITKSMTPGVSCTVRKKKTRVREKDFDELYVSTGETLGQGAFGDVRTYRHVDTDVEYAVKLVTVTKKRSRDKVLREIEILMHCRQHPNIVNIWQFFEKPTMMILVFEKLNGGTLINNAWNQKSLTEEDISQVVKNIANGLYFLHKLGVAHRDLKPDNILCVTTERLVPLKLIDFDLASDLVHSKKNPGFVTTPRLCSPVGSTDFMAPEVVRTWQSVGYNRSSYDKRCDLWSLGVLLYLLLCGYMPFRDVQCGDSNCEWNKGKKCEECQNMTFELIENGTYTFSDEEWGSISLEAKELVAKLLVRNPWSRFLASDVLRHVWLSEEFAHVREASALMLKRDPVENISACVDGITAASHQFDDDFIAECQEPSKSLPADVGNLLCALDDLFQLDIDAIERDCAQIPDRPVDPDVDRGKTPVEDGLFGDPDGSLTAEVCTDKLLYIDVDCESGSSMVFSPRDDCEDELLFHMSDIDDPGIIVEWDGKDDDQDALSLEWLEQIADVDKVASQSMAEEDHDSGNGNSTDSGGMFIMNPLSGGGVVLLDVQQAEF